jgi:hypothetical protein
MLPVTSLSRLAFARSLIVDPPTVAGTLISSAPTIMRLVIDAAIPNAPPISARRLTPARV